MTTEKPLDDKPYVGNLHTAVSQRYGDVGWLVDGNDVLATPMCGSLLYKCAKLMLGTLVAIAVAASAMPTPEQTMEAERVVRELLREDQAALKRGRKTRAEVAGSALALAGQTESEAAKFLLMKGAYSLYVRAGEFDRAVETLGSLKAAIPDIPPDRMAGIIEAPLLGAPRRNCERLHRILAEAKLLARYAREVPELERSLRKTPDDQALRRSLAEHHACLGRWDLALENFSAVEGRAGEIAKAERDGSVDAAAAADFWWRYPSGKEELERYFRAHAATLYEKAIASGALSGLDKVLAERRIAEAKAGDLSAEPATAKRPEVTAGNTPRTASASAAGRLYCVVNLSAGPNATRYPVSYLSAAPRGGWPDVYKTTKLVLRRIEPGTFIMGEDQKDESHRVTLTKPFYIGVFEVTQKQYALVTWAAPSAFKGDMRPVENVSYEMIRGKDEGAKWPSSSGVDTYSFLGKLRARTGLDFDLPTEAQWEYACRAGTKSKYNNGGDTEGDLKKLGRFVLNQKGRGMRESYENFARHKPDGKGGHSHNTVVAGAYEPNKWGVYDMHGNVWEWCLDWWSDGLAYGTNPVGPASAARRVLRGGCWNYSADMCTSFSRGNHYPSYKTDRYGFRLAFPLLTVEETDAHQPAIAVQSPSPKAKYQFKYRLDGNGNATLIGSPCVSPKPEGVLVVPDKIDGHTVTKIDNCAFAECDKMTRVILPSHLEEIVHMSAGMRNSGYIFWGCCALEAIEIARSNPKYTSEKGVLYTKDKKCLIAYPKTRSEITLARETKVVGLSAFVSCTFKTARIPEPVESIGFWAFSNCQNLKVVEFPKSVKWIGAYVFDKSWSMQKVVFLGDAPEVYVRRTPKRENLFSESSRQIVVVVNSIVEVKKESKGWKTKGSTELPERWPTVGSDSRFIRHIQ